jgi:hypothetical protein
MIYSRIISIKVREFEKSITASLIPPEVLPTRSQY